MWQSELESGRDRIEWGRVRKSRGRVWWSDVELGRARVESGREDRVR